MLNVGFFMSVKAGAVSFISRISVYILYYSSLCLKLMLHAHEHVTN